MTLTPLHIAFVLVLKPMLRKLDFVALTVGAVSHSRHRASGSLDVWLVSVLWLGFSMLVCSRQAGLHSIVGALPIDAILTMFFVKSIGKLGVERWGIRGFTNVKIEAVFFASAAIGSLSHVFVDWHLHHPATNFLALFGRLLVLCR
jgi:hypothetical protein